MWYPRKRNPDTQAIEAQASALTQANLRSYCALAFNEMLDEFEQRIGQMEDGPKKEKAIAKYEALEFAAFFEENQAAFFKTLQDAFFKKLWEKAEAEEASRPSVLPPSPQPSVFEEPPSSLAEPTSAVLPLSPPSEASYEPSSVSLDRGDDSECASQLFSPDSVKTLLDSVGPEYRRETCSVLQRIEGLMIERMSAELSSVL